MTMPRANATVADLAEFHQLHPDVKSDVEAWQRELRAVAKPGLGDKLAVIAARMRVSPQTARRKHDAYLAKGWRGLADARKARRPADGRGLPPKFVEHVKERFGGNQRKNLPAWRGLVGAWQRGEEIPGYEQASAFDRDKLPKGWTYSNLSRYARLTELEQVAERQGLGAAMAHAPQVFTTRAGLWPGAMLMLDDVWHDNFVVWRGKPVRVLQLSCLDVFSGCVTGHGTKPRLELADGRMDQLKEAQTCFLLAQHFALHGYSPRRTTILAEHGTAAVRAKLAALLSDRTGGLIRVRESGITGKEQAVAGMFDGRGGGNFRFKSCLESLHNLFHNELGALPGQTGMDVARRPEQLDGGVMRVAKDGTLVLGGLLSHVTDLGRAMALLPPAVAARLRMPLLNYEAEFRATLRDVVEWINRRGEWEHFSHRLEGWAECGHFTTEYRATAASDHWLKDAELRALPAPEQAMLGALARSDAATYSRTRPLSPREVWSAGRDQLIPLPPEVIVEILLGGEKVTQSDRAVERPCRDGYFVVHDQELSLDPLRFASRVRTPDGRDEELRPDTYLTVLNPYQPEFLWVHDAAGRLLGLAKRDHRPCRDDVDAVRREFGEKAKRLAEQLLPLRARHMKETRRAAAEMGHNTDVIERAVRGAAEAEADDAAAADAALATAMRD